MKKEINNFIICFCLLTSSLQAQFMGDTHINERFIEDWKANDSKEYSGNYHFGDSEGESNLSLFIIDGRWHGQIRTANWHPQVNTWVSTYIPLHKIKISSSGEFFSEEYNGEFVFFADSLEPRHCLKIYDSWSALPDSAAYELGWRSDEVKHLAPGDYPEASNRFLTKEDLKKYSKEELVIMRNEIFARYGYRFRSESLMDQHFSSKNWYRPYFDFVGGFLSELELHNISLIQAEERSR